MTIASSFPTIEAVPSQRKARREWARELERIEERALESDGDRDALRREVEEQTTRAGELAPADEARSETLAAWLAGSSGDVEASYVDAHGWAGVRRFESEAGATIFCMHVETFPGHVNNVYRIMKNGRDWLLDAGSGLDGSEAELDTKDRVLSRVFGVDRSRFDVDACIVSHGHLDHFGGVRRLHERARVPIWVHHLDADVIRAFDTRLAEVAPRLEAFFVRAGLAVDKIARLLELYSRTRKLVVSVPVRRLLDDGDAIDDGIRVIHVPGHCPGLIVLRVDDVLLTSDHVLADITPHQFPESIARFGGLGHYLESLRKVRGEVGVHLGLGGHEGPIHDVRSRIDAIAAFHESRLDAIWSALDTPKTVEAVSRELFGAQSGYGVILALEEAAAHLEELVRRGRVAETSAGASAAGPDLFRRAG